MLLRIIILSLCLQAANAFADDKADINNVLDTLHDHAANARMNAYFALYDDNAVFIGTDATETWTLDEFKNYAKPVFSQGTGWTYIPVKRQVHIADSAQTAWFVELLESETYGTTRGSGVLIKTDNGWKVAQYHLTIPIPNALAKEVTSKIKASQR